MKNLLIGRIRRCANFLPLNGVADVLDMRYHRGSSILKSRVLLATTDASNMGRNAGVDDDIVFSGIAIDAQSP